MFATEVEHQFDFFLMVLQGRAMGPALRITAEGSGFRVEGLGLKSDPEPSLDAVSCMQLLPRKP